MATTNLIQAVTAGLEQIPEIAAHLAGQQPPAIQDVYVVLGHERALNPDTLLVVGDRGSGKSFWCAALNDAAVRNMLSQQLPRLHLDNHQVAIGFAGGIAQSNYPSARVLQGLLKDFEAETIWRTVVLHQLLGVIGEQLPGDSWKNRVDFISENAEQEEVWLAQINSELQKQRKGFLIVFDALDRLGNNWPDIRRLTQGLLRVGLDMQSFSAIHLKLFMRPDMWADQSIWAFPDASKLQHNKVVLEWHKADLYGLLWHWLANRPEIVGSVFRDEVEKNLPVRFQALSIVSSEKNEVFYLLPNMLKTDESLQESLFNLFASPYMGTNKKRGKTYAWLPSHLADAKGQVSPRSFLLALKESSYLSSSKANQLALHYEAIKSGVTKASEIRIQELKEDYPWVGEVLRPLSGFIVPAKVDELIKRWKDANVLEQLANLEKSNPADSQYLPPYALEVKQAGQQQLQSLLNTLAEIGVVRLMVDGRVNIPDLFRVGAGISRRGGVKPVR